MTDSLVTIVGRLTGHPKWGHTKTRDVYANFDVAVNHGYFDREQHVWIETGSSYFKVSTFRNMAINVIESLDKGMPVVVQGKLRVDKWENGDKQGTDARIEATAIGPDLQWGQATFTPRKRPILANDDPMDDPNVRQSLEGDLAGDAASGLSSSEHSTSELSSSAGLSEPPQESEFEDEEEVALSA